MFSYHSHLKCSKVIIEQLIIYYQLKQCIFRALPHTINPVTKVSVQIQVFVYEYRTKTKRKLDKDR
jgi:hypothetical protein